MRAQLLLAYMHRQFFSAEDVDTALSGTRNTPEVAHSSGTACGTTRAYSLRHIFLVDRRCKFRVTGRVTHPRRRFAFGET